MLIGRFLMIVPIMALAGSLAQKKIVSGQRRHVSGLRRDVCHSAARHGAAGRRAEFPAGLTLGPIVEHFLMLQGKLFNHIYHDHIL